MNTFLMGDDGYLYAIQPFDLKSLVPDPWVVFDEKDLKYVKSNESEDEFKFSVSIANQDMFYEYVSAAKEMGWTNVVKSSDNMYVASGPNHRYWIEVYLDYDVHFNLSYILTVFVTFDADR